jgi:integrase
MVGKMVGKRSFTNTWVNSTKSLGYHADWGCKGLYLQVTQTQTQINKSWLFRYTSPISKIRREMGLGSLQGVPLIKARQLVLDYRALIADKKDPIEEEKQKKLKTKAQQTKKITFDEASKDLIDAKKAEWTNEDHHQQWINTLKTYASPTIGNIPVNEITTDHIIGILRQPVMVDKKIKLKKPFWEARTETATRVRQRIESVIDMCKALGKFQGENPARFEGHLSTILPKPSKIRKTKNHPAVPFIQINQFMTELKKSSSTSSLALQFLIHTAARTGEVINAQWPEIDFKESLWTVPATRMKAKAEHRVPLNEDAIKILETLKKAQQSPYIFPGQSKKEKGLSDMAMRELMKKITSFNSFVPHGFRSTFRDWAAETTNCPNHTVELALAHTIKNKTEKAYRRMDQLDKRRSLMSDWGNYINRPIDE